MSTVRHANRVPVDRPDRTVERRTTLGDGCWLCRPGDRRELLRAEADQQEAAEEAA